MKTSITILLIISIAGNIFGAYLLYKAVKLRDEVRMYQKYHQDLLAKYSAAMADFAGEKTYNEENRKLLKETTPEERKKMTVLYGASITKSLDVDKLLPGLKVINRGVGSQMCPQLLGRFSSDVLQLNPGKVVIKLCSGNFFPEYDFETIWNQFEMMVNSAKDRGITPILATVVPLTRAGEKYGDFNVTGRIKEFNNRIKKIAAENNYQVVDYFAALADSNGLLPDSLARDEIHPNEKGVEIMTKTVRPFVE
jgi:lysophospholipase L1-like esterase